MNNEELKALLQQADEHNNTSNYNEAERLANEVLAELDKMSGSAENREVKKISLTH